MKANGEKSSTSTQMNGMNCSSPFWALTFFAFYLPSDDNSSNHSQKDGGGGGGAASVEVPARDLLLSSWCLENTETMQTF